MATTDTTGDIQRFKNIDLNKKLQFAKETFIQKSGDPKSGVLSLQKVIKKIEYCLQKTNVVSQDAA